ncbi:hypothetical protein Ddye_023546 [Dipteronia dyeriana]|uniref:MULE transposase domain-containing protein n=1 Tax=Dipteronia dyeriana TaxID=168575 RepID=A0AAD9TU66_9ROSI|nr:hypothetical protein Ddye_023546 [Dipteronia dyeriana]
MCGVPPEVTDHVYIPGPQVDEFFGCQIEMNDGQYNHQYNEMYNDMNNEQNNEPNFRPIHEVDNEANLHPVYSIAFGYGDSEKNLSWEWFLDCLKGALSHIDDLVFISDRHASIEAGISKVFPYATHTICSWHFSENIKKRYHIKDVATIMNKAA